MTLISGKGDLFFPLRNYLPDRTATKRTFLFLSGVTESVQE